MPGSSPASHRKRWCMVKRGRAKRVDPAQALRYRTVGESLLRSAGAMVELSDLARYYGNMIAIVSIHAVIAYNDALTLIAE